MLPVSVFPELLEGYPSFSRSRRPSCSWKQDLLFFAV